MQGRSPGPSLICGNFMEFLKRNKSILVVASLCSLNAAPIAAFPTFLKATDRSIEFPHQWDCFAKKDVRFQCHAFKSMEKGKYSAELRLFTKARRGSHEYFVPHAISLDRCKEYLSEWRELLEGEKEVCLLGRRSFGNLRAWERLLTPKGCSSWFGQSCKTTISTPIVRSSSGGSAIVAPPLPPIPGTWEPKSQTWLAARLKIAEQYCVEPAQKKEMRIQQALAFVGAARGSEM